MSMGSKNSTMSKGSHNSVYEKSNSNIPTTTVQQPATNSNNLTAKNDTPLETTERQ